MAGTSRITLMCESLLKRRMVVLAAAYVIVLQALLLPLAVAAGSPYTSIICKSLADNTQVPTHHESGCPCAAGCGLHCGTHVLAAAPPIMLAPALTQGYALLEKPVLVPVIRKGLRRPQNPRAPPVA